MQKKCGRCGCWNLEGEKGRGSLVFMCESPWRLRWDKAFCDTRDMPCDTRHFCLSGATVSRNVLHPMIRCTAQRLQRLTSFLKRVGRRVLVIEWREHSGLCCILLTHRFPCPRRRENCPLKPQATKHLSKVHYTHTHTSITIRHYS